MFMLIPKYRFPFVSCLVYSYLWEGIDGDVCLDLGLTRKTVNRAIGDLLSKRLLDSETLKPIAPPKTLFRWYGEGKPLYYPVSLERIGTIRETILYYRLKNLSTFNVNQSYEGLSVMLGLDRKAIAKMVERLEGKGLIAVTRKKGGFRIDNIFERKHKRLEAKVKPIAEKVVNPETPITKQAEQPKQADQGETVGEILKRYGYNPQSPGANNVNQLLAGGMPLADVEWYLNRLENEPITANYAHSDRGLMAEAQAEHERNGKGNPKKWYLLFKWKITKS